MKLPNQYMLMKLSLAFSALVLAMSACFFSGVTQGENNINARWQKEKLATAEQLVALQGEIKLREFGHRQETARISDQLRKSEDRHEKVSAALAAEHALRLRLSTERAAGYARIAQSGSAECRSLASHAAELDRALEEGRGLVGELQEALGHRDAQLRLLGAQITNDRSLLDGH